MSRLRDHRPTLLVLTALGLVTAGGCGVRPYRAMAKAATSETNVFAQVDDDRLKISMRQALLKAGPQEALHIKPYAYMGHAYLVGFVESDAERQNAIDAVQQLAGVRSVDTYLPDRPANASSTHDLTIEASVKGALAVDPNQVVTRVTLAVLDGHVVLLGVLDSQRAIDSAVADAQRANGVTGVTNFLLLPEPEYERLRPSLR